MNKNDMGLNSPKNVKWMNVRSPTLGTWSEFDQYKSSYKPAVTLVLAVWLQLWIENNKKKPGSPFLETGSVENHASTGITMPR